MEPNRRGRPTILTAERSDALVSLIRAGIRPEHAAKACGIAPSTFYYWQQRASHAAERRADDKAVHDELDARLLSLFDRIDAAQCEVLKESLDAVRSATKGAVSRRVVRTTRPVFEKGRPLVGEDGEPITYDEVQIIEEQKPDWRAALSLYTHYDKRQSERRPLALAPHTGFPTDVERVAQREARQREQGLTESGPPNV